MQSFVDVFYPVHLTDASIRYILGMSQMVVLLWLLPTQCTPCTRATAGRCKCRIRASVAEGC